MKEINLDEAEPLSVNPPPLPKKVEYTKEELIAMLQEQGHEVMVKGPGAQLPEPGELPEGHMRTAECILVLGPFSSIRKVGMTPAEALLLLIEHSGNAKGMPLVDVVETEPVLRSNVEEVQRLKGRYDAKDVARIFGTNCDCPTTYQRAVELGMAAGPQGPNVQRYLTLTKIA